MFITSTNGTNKAISLTLRPHFGVPGNKRCKKMSTFKLTGVEKRLFLEGNVPLKTKKGYISANDKNQEIELTSANNSKESTKSTSLPDDYPQLFSNLNEATLKHEPGSLTSSILLVAGTTVGAGILAIPAVTQEAGFLASAPTCILCWLYMVATGLLVAEVNVNTMCELGSGGVSLVSMAERTLGRTGVAVSCFSYVFIHYALLVAYVARSSEILSSASGVPPWIAALGFTGAFGSLCYFGSQKTIGLVNGLLVSLILLSFSTLLAIASQSTDFSALLKADFAAVPHSIPIIALSFVYQNVVPVLATNLEGNLPRIRTAIIMGTIIPLVMFLAWDGVILGSVPSTLPDAIITSVVDPLKALRDSSSLVGPIVEAFSFLAIATSYIGFVLGLSDFLADWLKLPSGRGQEPLPFALCLFPPFFLALLNPDIFFKALDFAGTYGVMVLFGVIPGAMAWSERYSETSLKPILPPIVPGGKVTLLVIMGTAGVVILSSFFNDFFTRM